VALKYINIVDNCIQFLQMNVVYGWRCVPKMRMIIYPKTMSAETEFCKIDPRFGRIRRRPEVRRWQEGKTAPEDQPDPEISVTGAR
jgi:hypothetical protein